MKAIPKNASVLEAQLTPRLLYIAEAKRGEPALKELRIKSSPANTLALYNGYALLRYGSTD